MPPNPQPSTLLVIILNYRTPHDTVACLQSLGGEVATLPGLRVVVVDNGSDDGSAGLIRDYVNRQRWGDWVSVLALADNGGYAIGNNAAIQPALTDPTPVDYYLLLNSDTRIRPAGLTSLVAFMDAHPEVGIAGSRLEDPDGAPQCSAFRFPSVWSEFESSVRLGLISRLLHRWVVWQPIPVAPGPTDWVAGAAMLVRRQVFQTCGLLDPGYFLYYEDVDFCRRASLAGWACWYVPTSRVVHLVGQSTGVDAARGPTRRHPGYWFEARRRYFVTHHGQVYAALADIASLLGHALWQVHRRLRGKPDSAPLYFGRDLWRHAFGKTTFRNNY